MFLLNRTIVDNVLDLTKDWPDDVVPYQEIGKLVLTQNPKNYFAEIEQAAFSPSHMAQGCEPSEDPVLQSRLFAYPGNFCFSILLYHCE
jgi:catalase